jgi:translation initiation factor IF-1
MARKDAIEVEGTVAELLPNTMLRVEILVAAAYWRTSQEKCPCT